MRTYFKKHIKVNLIGSAVFSMIIACLAKFLFEKKTQKLSYLINGKTTKIMTPVKSSCAIKVK